MNSVSSKRKDLLATLFPTGVPRLWCPTLTHFRACQEHDATRIRSHLRFLSANVRGILVPGSTGEGWEMNDQDIRKLLETVLEAAHDNQLRVLIGVLKTNIDEVLSCLDSMQGLRSHPAVVGVTVCPPSGSELSQPVIFAGLASILRKGWPTALYQLPQVTQNEMSPATVALLASEFDNFILFKDTSGSDRVANSGLDFEGLFMVRGSEQGGYANWPRSVGGPYDGYLLSTANVFSKQLNEILVSLDRGDISQAQKRSTILVDVVGRMFALVRDFPSGNPFANANKVLDHCMAYGAKALKVDPPLLYGGARLSEKFVIEAIEILNECSLMPNVGYLDSSS